MNKDLKNGLIVAGVGVLAYLLYKELSKKKQPQQPENKVATDSKTYKQSVMPLETVMISSN